MTASAEEIHVSLLDMVLCLTRAIDFLHPSISEHHLRVAYIASCLAEELGFDTQQIQDVMIAGALHDLAAVSSPAWTGLFDDALTRDRLNLHRTADEIHRHGFEGYLMLRDFQPFSQAARVICFHHIDWDYGIGSECHGEPVPFGSHILRLADRVAILPNETANILDQAAEIRQSIAADSGRLFNPEVVEAFEESTQRESFWMDLRSRYKEQILRQRFDHSTVRLGLDGLHGLARVFGKIIDHRSSFTATHSSGVAATSENLAARLGLGLFKRRLIGVAGYLHDIGKLAMPPAILDKPGKLTQQEMLIIRQHPYYTHQILSMVPGLETVNTWASLHHERLDGSGYPFRPRKIPLGARIIAVADIFTAITEHRPYRRGMSRAECLAVLDRLVLEKAIDGDIVAVLRNDFEELHHIRSLSQQFDAINDAVVEV
ncbi:MAG TPA: HD domain-containing phosphohydrolase [Paucimonas sp.]|nr:HD domain-containing phosphohydrolase [Paucimonas sp.]